MLYSDPLHRTERSRPLPEIWKTGLKCHEYGVLHQAQGSPDPGLIQIVCDKMRDKKLIIANRSSPLRDRSELSQPAHQNRPIPQLAPYELVMMTFIDMDSPGLVVLPTHRVVHGLESFSPDDLRDHRRSYFSVEEVDPSIDAKRALEKLRAEKPRGLPCSESPPIRAFLFDTPRPLASEVLQGSPSSPAGSRCGPVAQMPARSCAGHLRGRSENILYARDAADAMARVREETNVCF